MAEQFYYRVCVPSGAKFLLVRGVGNNGRELHTLVPINERGDAMVRNSSEKGEKRKKKERKKKRKRQRGPVIRKSIAFVRPRFFFFHRLRSDTQARNDETVELSLWEPRVPARRNAYRIPPDVVMRFALL